MPNFKNLSDRKRRELTTQYLLPMLHAQPLLEELRTTTITRGIVDFHVVMPILFESAGKGSKAILPGVANWLPEFLRTQHSLGMQLFVTEATLNEFLDQLLHQIDGIMDLSDVAAGLMTLNSDVDFSKLPESSEIRKKLEVTKYWLTERGFQSSITPIQRFEALLQQKQLRGIGDIGITVEPRHVPHYRKLCDELTAKQVASRFDRDKRKYIDKMFHYGADSLNILLTQIVNQNLEGRSFLFTNTTFAYRETGMNALNHLSLVVLKNLHDLDECSEDRLLRLKSYTRNCIETLKVMEECDGRRPLPHFIIEQNNEFVFKTVPMLLTRERRSKAENDQDKEELREVFASPKLLKSRMDRAIDTIRSSGKSAANYSHELVNIGTWDGFGLSEDPIYRRIVSEFGIPA
ncbi:MAG: hypothetical protein KDB27_16155 [Planctomycetales bacterium]|nr:hypothetical protein [Planctomycetales bacterium]